MRFAWVALFAVAACAGVAPHVASPAAAPAPVTFVVRVPHARSDARSRNRPLYVASTTESVALTVKSGTTTVLSSTFGVTSTSNGCTTTSSVTTCTETFTLAPGTYTASVSTYDGASGSGNVLSEAQSIAFTVSTGVANAVPLTLYGVPASISVAAAAQTSYQSGSSFTVFGSSAQSYVITAKDDDGNAIVGAGLPSWNVALASGSGFTIGEPSGTSDTFTLQPSGNVSETFTVTASFTDSTVCAQSDAVCTTTFSAKRNQELVYCGGSGDTYVLAAPYTGSPTPIDTTACGGDSGVLATDAYGDVFAGYAGSLAVIPPPYSSVDVVEGGGSWQAFAVDNAGDAYWCNSSVEMVELIPPYPDAPHFIADETCPADPEMVMDGAVLLRSGESTGYVQVMASPYATPYATLSPGPAGAGRQDFAVDSAGDFAEGDLTASKVAIFPSSLANTPVLISVSPAPHDLAFDASGNLFVNLGETEVVEFKPPFSSSSTSTKAATGTVITRLLLDAGGDLFYADGSDIYEVAPPYSGSPVAVATPGTVDDLAITP